MEIKLTDKDKRQITHLDDLYGIMQRILLRENKIDREKEHFWIIGFNTAGYILYIELVSLGSVRATIVEPMNVYRIAVMKNATRVIAVHNHPGGSLDPSDNDRDITDRLIQVGHILDIELVDHLIVTPMAYLSFRAIGLMDELETSLKYVPTFQVIEKIRKEEKAIAKEAIKAVKDKADSEKMALMNALLEKDVSIENIAKIMEITPKAVKKILNKK
ncbi:hypothetical protein CUZ56_01494 [Saezia sanguinis]|uniref:MPN domain-containing protein n=1 Tax=Saezia sanguinis TaxID=1965230 RepID=A0A433SDJ4_9BURK|nr:JAB domain-containing protein [Saezia sanguinis]RUS66704.1 hypothetical protein CUZ56_01494 [Saezia sanguinis]